VASFRAAPGSGIEATVDGAPLAIGKPSWLASRGFPVTQAERVLAELATAGQTPVLVAQDGTAGASKALVGVVAIADDVRPAAAETVQALRRSGVQRLVLLTGDNAATGQAIAASVGISPEDVHADLLPEDKVRVVRELASHHGGVAMVGDGVNDAPALAAATVGIAMGAAGSDAALETADVALVADDLTRLPWVLALSRKAARTIQVNVAFALTTKAIVLALAALGLANLWLAIAADTGASIVVILNGMRLLGRVPPAVHADLQTLRHRFGLEDDDHHNHGL
jgi:Cd2+/Zn2+-exporting ATPase